MEKPTGTTAGEKAGKPVGQDSPSSTEIEPKAEPATQAKRQVGELMERLSEDSFALWLVQWIIKESTAMKKGWIAFLFLALLLCTLEFFIASDWIYSPQFKTLGDNVQGLNARVTALGDELEDTKRDRDKYQTQLLNDENTMAPLREAANKQFAEADPSKRIDLLIQKFDSFQTDLNNKISNVGNPINLPIESATAEVTIKTSAATSCTAQAVGFGSGSTPLLVAQSSPLGMGNQGDGWRSQTATCSMIRESSKLLGQPITSLRSAGYLQIDVTPPNSAITSAEVIWTINGNTVLTFELPAQTAVGTHLTLRDLSEGLKPLSSTPDTSASPH